MMILLIILTILMKLQKFLTVQYVTFFQKNTFNYLI